MIRESLYVLPVGLNNVAKTHCIAKLSRSLQFSQQILFVSLNVDGEHRVICRPLCALPAGLNKK